MSTEVREPKPGEILGQHYLLDKELGRGGFGVVFKARHLEIERVVAIKVLLATFAKKDPRAKDRFKREAMIAASLNYPNSLRIFDYGETDEGVFYIVMEFVQGRELAKVLDREHKLAVPRAIHIVRQVLHALMEAHARGIVHRDIKPDNVMLVALSYDPDYVKVMDFGIAKMADSGESITQAGITLGTPRYMPIEQLKGARLGPATDLYAVGLMLYEMLVGRPAFTGETAVDTAVAVMQGGSVRVPAETNLPPPLVGIIEKAAAQHAEDRYQSARTFLEAINALDPGMLDVDAADRERFAADGLGALPTRRPPTAELVIEGEVSLQGDFEDAIKTQALATADVAARQVRPTPPRREMGPAERVAPTEAVDVAEIAAMTAALPSRASQEADETSLVSTRFGPPGAKPAAGAPPLLLILNGAILVIVLIDLVLSL